MMDKTTIAGHIAIVVTILITQAFQWFREARKHRWDKEQLAEMHKDIKANGWHKGSE